MTANNRLFPVSLLILLALSAWFLSLWADFPYFYHTDEGGKARQIIENTRNLHHPLLMLESAKLLVEISGVPLEPQAVTETGRKLSAWFCALSAVLLAWTIARFRPWPCALLAGALLVLQPDVQEYARYFKEDPSLLFGWACVFAALAGFEKHPGRTAATLLGIATATAASGKYVGFVMILPALLGILLSLPKSPGDEAPHTGTNAPGSLATTAAPSRATCFTMFFLATVITFAVINHRLLFDPATFKASLTKETTLVLEGQGGVTKSIPHAGFFERLLSRSAHLMPFAALGWWAAWRARRTLGLTPLLLVFSPWALAALLAFSAKDSGRYFLPANLGLAAAAALGVDWLAARIRPENRRPIAIGAAVLLLAGASFSRSWRFIDGFRSDARREMLHWINTNLPEGTRIIQGRKVCLPDSNGRFSDAWHLSLAPHVHMETTNLLAGKAESPAALAAAGFTHAALAGDEYEVYLGGNRAKPGREEEFRQRREFYLGLFQNNPVVWERPAGKVGTHQPPLRLVRLPLPGTTNPAP